MTLDIDGLPIEVFGHQGGSAYHGHAKARIYSPLIASLAESGDMVGGLLREGKAGPAEEQFGTAAQGSALSHPAAWQATRDSP